MLALEGAFLAHGDMRWVSLMKSSNSIPCLIIPVMGIHYFLRQTHAINEQLSLLEHIFILLNSIFLGLPSMDPRSFSSCHREGTKLFLVTKLLNISKTMPTLRHMTLLWCFQHSDFLHLNPHQFRDHSYWDHSYQRAWKEIWHSWCGLPKTRCNSIYAEAKAQACLFGKLFPKSHLSRQHPSFAICDNTQVPFLIFAQYGFVD